MNLFRSANSRISCKWQLIIFNSGLKGAVAVGLSLSPEMAHRKEWGVMITAIHCTVIFSILFHGILTSPLLSITRRYEQPHKDRTDTNAKFHALWSKIDRNYIIPLVSMPRSHPDDDDYEGQGHDEHQYDVIEDEEVRADSHSSTSSNIAINDSEPHV